MRDCGCELARAQGFREGVEGLRVGAEEAYVEDGFRMREIQGLEVGVEACAWCAKVRDSGGGGDSGTAQKDYLLTLSAENELGHCGKVTTRECFWRCVGIDLGG